LIATSYSSQLIDLSVETMKITSSVITSLFLVLSITCLVSTTAQDETCVETAFTNVVTCVGENPCTCVNCNATSEDFNPTFPITCSDLSQSLCPSITCCSACATSLLEYYQCFVVDVFASSGLLSDVVAGEGSCTLDCSSFPIEDEVDPNCDEEDYVCIGEYADYLSCFMSCDSTGCTDGGAPFNQTMVDAAILEAENSGSDTCAILNAYACPADSDSAGDNCCPECNVQWANFYQCIANQEPEPCTIACAEVPPTNDGTPTSTTNGAPTETTNGGQDVTPTSAPNGAPTGGQTPSSAPTSAASGSQIALSLGLATGAVHAVNIMFAAAFFVLL
jgi:hypothetical protein